MRMNELTISEVEILMGRSHLEFVYVNYKGVTAIRKVVPIKIFYGTSKYHLGPDNEPEYTFFLTAYDEVKGDCRDFKISDIIEIKL